MTVTQVNGCVNLIQKMLVFTLISIDFQPNLLFCLFWIVILMEFIEILINLETWSETSVVHVSYHSVHALLLPCILRSSCLNLQEKPGSGPAVNYLLILAF